LISSPGVMIDLTSGTLTGDVVESEKRLKDLAGVFVNESLRARMDPATIIYRVQTHVAEKEGMEGGLFYGTSFVYPGLVGDEYFMTKGHFHSKIDRAEYYWCIQGEGMLILMDIHGKCWAEKMVAGSLHYISGYIAHRIANTGRSLLAVGACWPSDAGHDYKTITDKGFMARLRKIDGVPQLIPVR
jgi:glucose-6-phosphate isomerase